MPFTKITAGQNEGMLSYHRACGLYFLVVISVRRIHIVEIEAGLTRIESGRVFNLNTPFLAELPQNYQLWKL